MNLREIGASETTSLLLVVGTVVGLSVGGYIVFSLRGSDNQADNTSPIENDMLTTGTGIDFKTETTGQLWENVFTKIESRTRIKNVYTDNLSVRTDTVENRYSWGYVIENSIIINLADNEFWLWRPSSDWKEVSLQDYNDYFADCYALAENQMERILGQSSITSEGFTYEENYPGNYSTMTVRIYDIKLDQAIADSVFQPS